MFGCIAAGRPVQTNIVQVDSTKYIFELTDASSINHLVIFLVGQPFPDNFGATVHFLWPTQQQWVFLGILTNEKPSAIFKLGGTKHLKSTDMLVDESPFDSSSKIVAQIGISIEPLENVLAQQRQRSESNQLALRNNPHFDTQSITSKILESFYNYCTSFSTSLPPGGQVLFNIPQQTLETTFIPLKALSDWFKQTQNKLDHDPSLFRDMEI
ncbi:hypothetical protein HDV06_004294 [Boothiomyces sp. JEL0866]|nr:hypothetical protein HDV06_004294 [Boothiomyces sp. JEL0866]